MTAIEAVCVHGFHSDATQIEDNLEKEICRTAKHMFDNLLWHW